MQRTLLWNLSAVLMLAAGLLSACEKAPREENKQEPADTQPAPKEKKCILSVMSFNVAVDNLGEGTGWQWRKSVVNSMLSSEKPQVIGFQEAQAHEITDMVNAHPEYDWYGLGRDTGKKPANTTAYEYEESMAIFWLRDVLEVPRCGTFWLSETPDEVSKGWDAAYNRTCTWAEFVVKETGQQFFLFNTHLDNKGKTARTNSMVLIARKMLEINKEHYPAFLSADFNTTSGDAIFAPIRTAMKSTRDYAPDSEKDKMTYNGYKAPKSQIDHIFYSGNGLVPLTFRVLDSSYGAYFISDHYPIMATYRYTTTE